MVDDGSPDCCGEICDEYAKKDSRIVVIHQENCGLSAARNAGLDICTGAYIAFVDSDDYVEYDMLYQLYHEIGEAELCGCGMISENTDGSILAMTKPRIIQTLPGVSVLRQHYSGENGVKGISAVTAWGKLYRRALFEDLRFREGLLFEDIHLMPYILMRCRTARYLPYAGYHYIITPDSITRSSKENFQKQRYEDCFRIWEEHEQLYQQWGLNGLAVEVACAREDKLIVHILAKKVPDDCLVWSKRMLYQNTVRLLAQPIGISRKLRYVTFCLLGGYGHLLPNKKL